MGVQTYSKHMSQDVSELFVDVMTYLEKAYHAVKPAWVAIVAAINYVLFPTESYIPAAVGLGGAVIVDILTKYYSLSIKHGGIKNAIKARAITSESLWIGTRRKLISYLVVMILCGLAVRVTRLTTVVSYLVSIPYAIMFLRECQSVLENLLDAGHSDLEWFLILLRRKEKTVLEEAGSATEFPIETPAKGADLNARV